MSDGEDEDQGGKMLVVVPGMSIDVAGLADGDDDPPLEDIIREVRRELSARRRLYPRWVAQGKLPANVAHDRMRLMDAALRELRKLERQPELAL